MKYLSEKCAIMFLLNIIIVMIQFREHKIIIKAVLKNNFQIYYSKCYTYDDKKAFKVQKDVNPITLKYWKYFRRKHFTLLSLALKGKILLCEITRTS